MGRLNDRYGIPGAEIQNLYHRWRRQIKNDTEWESFDAFVYWSAYSRYKKGLELRKHDITMPHGPDNSFWYSGVEAREIAHQEQKKKMGEYYSIESPFCKKCGIKKRHCLDGCSEWKQWWIKNWNTNICVKPVTEEPPKREKYKYEHPDLQREGIVFEAPR